MAVNGFWERIERMGNGALSTDFGNGLNGFGERIEWMGERIGALDSHCYIEPTSSCRG